MNDLTSDTLSDWSNVTAGLHTSVISIDNKFLRSVAPAITPVSNVNVSGWRGEKVSAQLLLWTSTDIDEVEYAFNDFRSEGNSLPASVAQTRFVRYAIALDLDGFLRWAYNSWVENPLTDSRFRTWPAGDTYFVYPDARSSIRFERLVEGIQDAEKIRVLRKKYTGENTPESLKKLAQLEEAIAGFGTLEPSSDWQKRLSDAKRLLNTL